MNQTIPKKVDAHQDVFMYFDYENFPMREHGWSCEDKIKDSAKRPAKKCLRVVSAYLLLMSASAKR